MKPLIQTTAGIALLLLTASAFSQSYTVTDLGSLEGVAAAFALNDSGEVVGAYNITDSALVSAFYWTFATGMTNLDVGSRSFAEGINSQGAVVGVSTIAEFSQGGPFVWTPTGGVHNIGTGGSAFAVNDFGQVVGIDGVYLDGFVWSNATGKTHIGTLGGTTTWPYAINEQGQVAGYSYTEGSTNSHAFLWNKSTGIADLGTLGGSNSFAYGVNDATQVVGGSDPANSSTVVHAFLWSASSGMVDLGTLGGDASFAQGINDPGQVVGHSILSDNSTSHAILWTAAKGMQDLNAMIPPKSGWVLVDASAINRTGQIAGSGIIGGQTHAFLLNPTHHH